MYEWGLIDLKRLHDDVEYWEQHDDPKQPDYDTRDIERVIGSQPVVDAIPLDKPFLKMRYKGYTVYNTEWLKEHIDMEYKLIKGKIK